jgi:hypothetical protein
MAERDEPRPRRSRAALLRIAFGVASALVLLVCLIGIMLSGPIVVPRAPVDWEVEVSADRLREAVQTLCTEFTPRDYRNRQNLDRAAEWIARQFRAAGLDVELQDYETTHGRYRNVVAHQPGTRAGTGAVIVGAHYDAFGELPGADDNASGVAVLLELVRTLPQRGVRAPRYFVAFSTEEPPAFGTDDMGSHHFARRLKEREVEIELMISLDLVGYYSDAPGSQDFPFPGLGLLYPRRGNFAAVIGDLGSGGSLLQVKRKMLSTRTIPVHSFRAPAWLAPVHLSDHLSFRRLGLPGVQITDTAFMRNANYHTAGDTPDTLDYERMALLVQALHGVLWDPEIPWDRFPRPRRESTP